MYVHGLLCCNSLVVSAPTMEAEAVGSGMSLDGGSHPASGEALQLPHPRGRGYGARLPSSVSPVS